MLVSVGGRTRAHLSIGYQSFHIAKIFDAKLSTFGGRGERGGGEGKRSEGGRGKHVGSRAARLWLDISSSYTHSVDLPGLM